MTLGRETGDLFSCQHFCLSINPDNPLQKNISFSQQTVQRRKVHICKVDQCSRCCHAGAGRGVRADPSDHGPRRLRGRARERLPYLKSVL